MKTVEQFFPSLLLTRYPDVYMLFLSLSLSLSLCMCVLVCLSACPSDCLSPSFFPSSLSLGAFKAKLPAGRPIGS